VAETPVQDVVIGAVESTERYLTFLRENNLGVDALPATGIRLSVGRRRWLENSNWQDYRCKLPQHLRLRPDSSATLIPHNAPAQELEIRIVEYDRQSGDTIFAIRDPVNCKTASVVVDFRWLVKRCLEWLQNNGTRVCPLEELGAGPRGENIPTNPPATGSRSSAAASVMSPEDQETMSEEQVAAVEAVLTEPLSYIWGAPGTGKTKFVLALAARSCIALSQRILVVASTNVSVDNAVAAILEKGVDRDKVLRIGVPSPSFVERYPECCEQRAFEQEISQIGSQIRMSKERMESLERSRRLEEQVRGLQAQRDVERKALDECRTDARSIDARLTTASTRRADREQELGSVENEITSKTARRKELSKAQAELQALESEQIRATKGCREIQQALENLGLLARLFTSRKIKLKHDLNMEHEHLQSIEETLRRRREKSHEEANELRQLDAELEKLASKRAAARDEIAELDREITQLKNARHRLESEIPQKEHSVRDLEANLVTVNEDLSRTDRTSLLGGHEEDIATLQAENDALEARLQKFRQDLDRKAVLGMTLDAFIGLTLQGPLSIHRVFLDEAPYAPLAKVLPLLSLRCPIAMFGDHFQLPPVCECGNDPIVRAYWAKPGIFLEDAFRFGSDLAGLAEHKEPVFRLTKRRDVKTSYRYAAWLSELLDFYVYEHAGLCSAHHCSTDFQSVHCEPRNIVGREGRQNHAEAVAIADFVARHCEQWKRENASVAVLAPYKPQVKLLQSQLGQMLDHIEVWNTHKTQGREWDWVLFSVCDTDRLQKNRPYFTDSNVPLGKLVLNTTISRAKQHLVLFLDLTYWGGPRDRESLMTALAQKWKHLL